MKTLTVQIPDSIEVNNRDLAMLVSTQLYEQGKLTLGQAAEVAGLSKRAFAECWQSIMFLSSIILLKTYQGTYQMHKTIIADTNCFINNKSKAQRNYSFYQTNP